MVGGRQLRKNAKVEIGWCEMVDIPSLGLRHVHAKMDTGAATSSIHATRVKPLVRDGEKWVEFWFRLNAGEKPKRYEAPLIDKRLVRSSNGNIRDILFWYIMLEWPAHLGKSTFNGVSLAYWASGVKARLFGK
jgi:hypothetical protein